LAKTDVAASRLSVEFARKANKIQKPVVVFFSGERSHEPIAIDDAVVFRHGPYRSSNPPKNYAMPSFVIDFVEHYFSNKLKIRRKQERATVGFCGFARSQSPLMLMKRGFYHFMMLLRYGNLDVSTYKGVVLRRKCLQLLAISSSVLTNFIVYDRMVYMGNKDAQQRRKLREEYVRNMAESDYILCPRGSANYSRRLYETLSCGRIPVIVNTDCVLPFDEILNWREFCVWIEESEIPYISEKIADFHSRLSPGAFEGLQIRCREVWKRWLSPEGFFKNLHRHFLLPTRE
jgi:hypothetical protein